jgi:hypothetical protein
MNTDEIPNTTKKEQSTNLGQKSSTCLGLGQRNRAAIFNRMTKIRAKHASAKLNNETSTDQRKKERKKGHFLEISIILRTWDKQTKLKRQKKLTATPLSHTNIRGERRTLGSRRGLHGHRRRIHDEFYEK